MTQADSALEAVLTAGHQGVLATIRRNGRPQLSVVGYLYDPATQVARVSVTATRAKTKNLLRDPRATLQVMGASNWTFVVADCDASLSAVTGQPDDEAAQALVALYRDQAGEHPDWNEFRQAMIADQRQVLSLKVTHLYGMVN